MTALHQWFPIRDDFTPRNHWAMSGDNFGCHSWDTVLVSSGWRLGMLLNILQGTGQPPPPPTKNRPTQNVNGAEVEKPWKANQNFAPESGGDVCFPLKYRAKEGCVGAIETIRRAHYNHAPLMKLVSWPPQKGRLRAAGLRLLLKINWPHWISCCSLIHSQSSCLPNFLLKIFLMN